MESNQLQGSTNAYPTAAGRASSARVEPARLERDEPSLHRNLNQLLGILSQCHDGITQVEQAAVRLTGPRPAEASGTSQKPPDQTIEQRIHLLQDVATALSHRINNAAQHLNAAV